MCLYLSPLEMLSFKGLSSLASVQKFIQACKSLLWNQEINLYA